MHALLLVSHGSQRKQSNDEVLQLAEKIQPLTEHHFDIVHAAFLELAEPLIPDGIKHCIKQGAKSVLVVPYFLAAGRHVAEDIPDIIEDARRHFPEVNITIASHLGASDLMPDFLAKLALDTER